MTEQRKIYSKEFNLLLRSISEISIQERDFLNRYFASLLVDGLTEFELKREISRLKFNTSDPINSFDAERVKRKLLAAMGSI